MSNGLPDFATLIDQFASNPRALGYVQHNIRNWACVNGSLALAQKYPVSFDPREEYWLQTERRVLVMYLVKRIKYDYRPHRESRRLAWELMRHFDRARLEGAFGEAGFAERHQLGWPELLTRIMRVANQLPEFPEFAVVRRNSRRRFADTLREDFNEFLESRNVKGSDAPEEAGFVARVRWFPYLGLADLQDLVHRQMYWAGFYGLFGGTNAYTVGGSLSLASILQNTKSDQIMGFINRWAQGELPSDTGFAVVGKNGPVEASDYAVVTELYGVLNLHRQPFFNGAVRGYQAYAKQDDTSGLQQVRRVGQETLAFLQSNPQATERYASHFDDAVKGHPMTLPLSMERRADEQGWEAECAGTDDISLRVAAEMRESVAARVSTLSMTDRAAIALHLHLDAAQLPWLNRPAVEVASSGASQAGVEVREPAPDYKGVDARQPEAPSRVLALPPSLQPIGNDALAYLRGGFHVLLAGAPGTGKTTLAQFVGHAWNRGLDRVVTSIPMADAPVTTVASSAWAPFHTIGGILPNEDGQFRVQQGIFIAPDTRDRESWRMRPECVVLDEMNRADLDRCIGELYPLLSHSVSEVVPAGVPGVRRIVEDARFRLVATVNDATIDDIVFPISEGLARRFIRIELQGALEEEVRMFLEGCADERDGIRISSALKAVGRLFNACREKGRVTETEVGDRLHFGVGYFGLLGAWVAGRLPMSQEFGEREPYDQAVEMLRSSLRSATRDRAFEPIFRQVAEVQG